MRLLLNYVFNRCKVTAVQYSAFVPHTGYNSYMDSLEGRCD